MMKNRFIAAILAVAMLVCLGSASVSANASVSSEVLLDLQGFGIVTGDENGELNLSDNVTRAEFCKMVSVMISGSAMPVSFSGRFADVGADHWAHSYVNMMAAYGLINGVDKNTFNPDGSITYEQAMKILVLALGYESRAEAAGGYPTGYTVTGIGLGIGKNVSANSSEPLLRADVMTMIHNCLDIRLMEPVLGQNGDYVIGNSTYRSILSGSTTKGIMELTGIITANYDSYIASPNVDIEPGQIEFFGSLVNIGNTNADSFLGQEVTIYVSYGENKNIYTATSVAPTPQNMVVSVKFDQIDSISSQKIVFEREDEEESLNMNGAVFVYNGAPALFDDIKSKLSGSSLTLISNDGDKNIDVVLIESYISGIVESVSARHEYITFKGQGPANHKKVYVSSDYENDYYTRIQSSDGKAIGLDELDEDSVLSLFFDNFGTLKMIKSGVGEIEGTVEAIGSANSLLTIDGNEYEIEKGVDLTNVLGKYVVAKLNFEGKIAQLEEISSDRNFGVIVAVTSTGGISENVKVKMLLPSSLAEQEEENEDPTAEISRALVARNKGVEIFDVAQTFKLNNEKYQEIDVLPAIRQAIQNTGKGYLVVEYTLNANNELRSVKDPDEIGTMTTKTYNSKEKTFGKTIEGSAFGINENTLSICVPRNAISSDDDYLAYISMSNGRSYRVSAFEYNENTYCADLIVVNETMTYETIGSITKASKVGLVLEAKKVLSDDIITQITMLTENGETTVSVSDHTSSKADFSKLKQGDLIYYSLDSAGYMDGYSLITSSDPLPETGSYSGDNAVYIGYVSAMRYNEVSNSLNCWVDTMEFVDGAGNTNVFEIRKTSSPPIYIYNTQSRTGETATTADLLRSHERVVIAASGQNVRAVLLIV